MGKEMHHPLCRVPRAGVFYTTTAVVSSPTHASYRMHKDKDDGGIQVAWAGSNVSLPERVGVGRVVPSNRQQTKWMEC
jgi:hypothetical protein